MALSSVTYTFQHRQLTLHYLRMPHEGVSQMKLRKVSHLNKSSYRGFSWQEMKHRNEYSNFMMFLYEYYYNAYDQTGSYSASAAETASCSSLIGVEGCCVEVWPFEGVDTLRPMTLRRLSSAERRSSAERMEVESLLDKRVAASVETHPRRTNVQNEKLRFPSLLATCCAASPSLL